MNFKSENGIIQKGNGIIYITSRPPIKRLWEQKSDFYIFAKEFKIDFQNHTGPYGPIRDHEGP